MGRGFIFSNFKRVLHTKEPSNSGSIKIITKVAVFKFF